MQAYWWRFEEFGAEVLDLEFADGVGDVGDVGARREVVVRKEVDVPVKMKGTMRGSYCVSCAALVAVLASWRISAQKYRRTTAK